MRNELIESIVDFKGKKHYITWIKDNDLQKYDPVVQVYGVVFNKKGEILISRKDDGSEWQIPGGKPEADESYEEALARELLEEVDATVKKITPLGAQKVVTFINSKKESPHYQLRYVALLDDLLPQTPDPDKTNNLIWQRDFVHHAKINEYVLWGELGEELFKDAVIVYKELLKS